jgi:hypothetical protein
MLHRKPKKPRYEPEPLPPLPLNIGINELGGTPVEPTDGWFWRLYCRIFRIEY